jgi:hypothetical protein
MNRASFPKDLEEGLNAHFGLEYREHPAEYTGVFDTSTSSKAFEEDVLMSGFGPAPIKGEGEAFSEDEARQGWTARYNHTTVGMKFAITQEAVEDNLYHQLGARYARALARSMRETKEVIAANILNRAFSGSYLGGDGKALLATDHPLLFGGTLSNKLATAADLSESSLEDLAIMIRTLVDDRSLPMAAKATRLIIPPQLMFEAARLVRSTYRPATGDNDINAIRSLGILGEDPHVVTRLTDTDAFFIKTDVMDGLKHFQRVNLQRGQEDDFNTGNAMYKARERYSFGWSDPRGLVGSEGA